MARAAYLRVYLPEPSPGEALEHVAGSTTSSVLTRGEFGITDESVRDDAFVIDIDGHRFVCPRHPRLRMLEGLLAFRNAYDPMTASTLVPEAVADRAADELRRIYQRYPDARSHILTSPFFVPLRWFSAFDPDERDLVTIDGSLSIRYRTRVGAAVERLERVAEVLEGAGFDEVVVDMVADVIEWVRPFPADGIVELDYGGVAELFSDTDLALDESAADIAASIDALESGDFDEAGEHYASAASRWAHAQALGYAN